VSVYWAVFWALLLILLGTIVLGFAYAVVVALKNWRSERDRRNGP
jgi:hypothetical protein